ncbi:MAG: hypothetical protein KME21_21335 [Desmonostoc vinosum HA7617-LM4]|nr:hypothetical protein [Desmonostoc vinosum HA7617-LM4]
MGTGEEDAGTRRISPSSSSSSSSPSSPSSSVGERSRSTKSFPQGTTSPSSLS